MADEKVQILIVGAGAAGCLFAAKLAATGRSVTVIDAGPAWSTDDLVSSQIWARRLRWGGVHVQSAGDHPFGVNFNSGWGFGGSALHHYGTWPRMRPDDFDVRTRHGRALEWPFGYATLQPYYDRIQEEVGVSGDATAEIWRPPGAPYPLPPLENFAQARLISNGFEKLGMKTAPSPMAILSRDYKGRPACVYDGWCDAGCPIGSLANPLVTYFPVAKEKGARFIPHAYATRLIQGRDAAHVSGVEYVDGDGVKRTIHADLVILAASTVFNPTLLLNSHGPGWEKGAANSSGLVGKYFMTHSIAAIYGFFDEETENYLGVSGAQRTNQDHYGKTSLGGDAFGSVQWQIGPTMKPNDLLGVAVSRADLFGSALQHFMERAVHHLAVMFGFGEGLPLATNRIELTDREGPDGTRSPRIVHAFDPASVGVWSQSKALGLRVFEAAGAKDAWAGPMASAHMMGGTIMGRDARQSVADEFGRSHDIRNLVLAGPGLFPTAGAMNPNFTNHAVSLRSVERLIARWKDYVD